VNPAGLQDPQTRTSDLDRPLGFLHEAPAADAHALAALEFSRVLDAVAGFAGTTLGADAVRALVPRAVAAGDTDAHAAIVAEHARVAAIGRVISGEDAWPSPSIPGLAAPLARLAVEGTTWSGAELRDAAVLLASSRLVLATLRAARSRGADVEALTPHAFALISDQALEESLGRVVDDEGVVRDGASPELRRVRKQLRGAEAELIRLLEQVMGRLESHHRVDDASVTMRNGRWVIPVRREGRGSVGGIVHDTSATGATVFVEPPAAVEFGNRIRELEIAERREVDRVLAEATAELRPRHDDLVGVLAALVDLDALVARARFAQRYRCAPCTLAPAGSGFAIVSGRHPLLAVRDPQGVVPFALALTPDEHTLLVSGPNTGGKTVLLKAVALLALMAQAGVPPTVGPESTVPLFDRVFADIGDEQSIEASLSTFSGHVRNLVDIVLHATDASLVLADELGSGTDPNEGAALGAAVLESLTRRGATTVATTHLGVLKQLAQEVPGVVNASLQFDEVALAPTYRLLKGIPGRSYGLSIARRLAMPADILANAEARVPEQERRAAALIEDLERRQREVEERERRADEKEEGYAERAERVLAREQAVKARERQVERTAHDEARKYVLEARKEIEAAIALVREAGAGGAAADAAAEARRAAERLLASGREAVRAIDAQAAREAEEVGEPGTEWHVGDTVSVASFGGAAAQVMEVRPEGLVVVMGSVRATVAPGTVRRVSRRRVERAAEVSVAGVQPVDDARPEVDVRGLRISEVDGIVQHAIDSAVRADLPALRIIHGKGTGALRERIGQLLRDDRRVRSFRLGAWNEGGAGVTIAEIA
jgi:DNA mismatch repair protein MutS2